MEIDVGGGGDDENGVGVSDAEEEQNKMSHGEDQKLKRKMKTAAQLQVLQRTYDVEPYPAEALRAELSIKLGLSDRQLNMWFCHRRLKDRKAKSINDCSPAAFAGVAHNLMVGSGSTAEIGDALSLGKNPYSPMTILQLQNYKHQPGSAVPRIAVGGEMPSVKRHYELPPVRSELRAVALVEAQLGEPISTDGPIFGMEFDPLPPGAFGTPIGIIKPAGWPCELYENLETTPYKRVERTIREYQFIPEQPSVRSDTFEKAQPLRYDGSSLDVQGVNTSLPSRQPLMHSHYEVSIGYSPSIHMPSLNLLAQPGKQVQHLSLVDINIAPRTSSAIEVTGDVSYGSHPNIGPEIPFMATKKIIYDEERLGRKRKGEETRIAREVEAHEKRIRKELEKQDILRRKHEEQIQRDLERQERERRKEEDRLLREKQREEERLHREQMREMERKERFLQKEYIRVEKMKIREELRKEKEAAKLKAANDRATARRMAKESVELIEDEHLELMELASSKKGLHSFSALDSDTLGDLKSFEDMLPDFPLKSVRLKRPFSTQPWDDSEENVGNLLMVWRFLINFADVLGLWPFTLEEFLQAFHEHDTRLMGEIHMALLRIIVKDIEDAARTLASAVGTNQSNVVNPAGGHPHIVEGAYSWGFDIKSWQKHINSLTWPEILRQLALSAGFGPKLKNKSVGQALLHGGNEGNDGANVISNLRNGVAAENALAMMQERGLSNPRRSRHRLTPGTVKYAAYYVLSLEGSNGLTIQDVAVKIQESGLRDLRTSKTPEASISAALSRDTKLFERTAPSTYCVRTPYRKDAADAEAVLTAAREKIQLYIGNSEGEEAEDVEKENTERDEDVESEVSEDHDVEDLCSRLSFDEEIIQEVDNSLGHGNINPLAELLKTTNLKSTGSSSISGHTEGKIETKSKVTSLDNYSNILEATNEGTPVVDENDLCEPWVQGLTEGEYYDLSVQERLNALVALIDVANEGHSMRSILEERMEAAYALKKQLWAEARLDKRRLKEDCTIRVQSSLYISNKGDQSLTSNMADSRQNPSVGVDVKSGLALRYNAVQSRDLSNQGTGTNVQLAENTLQEFTAITELHQSAYAFEKPKSQQKSFIAHKAEETYVYRSLPLGQDRRRNRYWQFITSQSLDDPESGRIFVELHDGRWRVIDSIEDFDSLLASIDVRGIRESHLHLMLQKVEGSFKEAVKRHSQRNSVLKVRDNNVDEMSPRASHLNTSANSHYQMSEDSVLGSSVSTSFIIDLEKNRRAEWEVLKRCQEFEKWMWKECFNSGILCAMKYGKRRCKPLLSICEYCHNLYYFDVNICFPRLSNQNSLVSNLKFLEHVTECKNKLGKEPEWMLHILQSSPPSRIRLLKALLASVEASVPPEALDLIWSEDCRDFWITKLQDASSASEILQTLTLFEGAVKRSFLSSDYESTNELFRSHDLTRSSFNYSSLKLVPVLPWIPETTSAVALRLMEFDKSIYYTLEQKIDLQKNSVSDNFMILEDLFFSIRKECRTAVSSKYPLVHNITEDMLIEPPGQNLTAVRTSGQITSRSLYRGRGRPRCREGKFQRIDIGAKREDRQRRITIKGEDPRPLPIWKGKSRRRGENCGRKSAKKMQKKDKQVTENTSSKKGSRKIVIMTTLTSKHQDNNGQASVQAENGKDISSPEQSPSNCYVAPAAVDKYESPEMVEGSGGLNEIPAISMKHVFDAVNEEDKEYEQVDDEKQDLHSEHYDLGQAYSGNRNLHSEDYDDNQPLDEDAAEYYHAESDEGGKGSCDGDQVENSDGESTYSSSEYSE